LESSSFEEFLRFYVVTLKEVQEEWFDSDGTRHRRVVYIGLFLNWKRWPKGISKKFLAVLLLLLFVRPCSIVRWGKVVK